MKRRPGRLIVATASVAALVLSCGAHGAESADDVRSRFLNEYRQAADKLSAGYTSFEATVRSYSFLKGEKRYRPPQRLISSPTAGAKTTMIDPAKPGEVVQVHAGNKDYGFTAVKNGDAFVVTEMSASDKGVVGSLSHSFRDTDSGRTYLDIAQDPAFTPVWY